MPTRKKKPTTATASARLMPPADGVVVRMYRIGHGDCFLLAFPGASPTKPAYVLIDCGYKPGSPGHINTTPQEITDNIRDATGGHIDVAVITHEHQDHVNAISDARFNGITIDEAWFAWTEDPEDNVADDLRKKFKDKLLGLLAARKHLAATGDQPKANAIDTFLAFELGGEAELFNVAEAMLGAAQTSSNKKSMKVFKDIASDVRFIRPHDRIHTIPGAKDVRVFALGPPRDPDQLKSLDPVGTEEFHLATGNVGSFFAAVANRDTSGDRAEYSPFSPRYQIPFDIAPNSSEYDGFFNRYYGGGAAAPLPLLPVGTYESPSDAEWRRIDNDWLYSAEQLALDMNDQTNNASLVLAFELGKGGKVLLFAADAQRGNWVSWARKEWADGDKTVTARDLLRRTVLYKVGHHGSHNATLNGLAADDHPNLAWMGSGEYAREFTAMITAVRSWAETQNGWDHPLKAIKEALLRKASGRVFQTDTDFTKMTMPAGSVAADWNAFQKRASGERLYFDCVIKT